MGLFKGSSGKISYKEGDGEEKFLAHTTSWSFDSSMDIDETAYFGGSLTEEGVTEKTPGTVGWSASIDGATDGDVDSNQDALFDAHNEQKLLTFMFYYDQNTAYTGEGYLESYNMSHAADGKGEFSSGVAGNGKMKKVTVP